MAVKQHGSSPRFNSVERWVARQLPNLRHERRVVRIADEIFSLTESHHQLETEHRLLLALGALIHDVGRSVDAKHHPMVGAAMILKDKSLPLTDMQRRQLAYLTRYHRGAVPKAGFDEMLRPGDGRKALRKVLALLRAADTLDNRQLPAPRVRVRFDGERLVIKVTSDAEMTVARKAFSRRKKFRLLEETLGCKIDVRVRERTRV